MARSTPLLFLALPFMAVLATLGCQPERPAPPASVDQAPPAALEVAGVYEVEGETVTRDGGDPRRITGTMVLSREGDRYQATYTFRTRFPGAEKDIFAEVIGRGEGDVQGRRLVGTADTQLVVAMVPGIDPNFAFAPRIVGARVSSISEGEFDRDGNFTIAIENQPAEGEVDYQPTRTTLKGKRIADSVRPGGLAENDAG